MSLVGTMSTNDETGETENSVHLTLNDFDLETGESNSPYVGPNLNIFRSGRSRTTTFHVPKSCFEESEKKKREARKHKSCISNKRTYYMADKRAVINLKEVRINFVCVLS